MAKGGFRGGYGGMNQANMMKQAQKMQEQQQIPVSYTHLRAHET